MKKLLLIFSLSVALSAKGQIIFQKMYSFSSYQDALSVKQTSDGGYIFTGYGYDGADSTTKIILIKTNAYGDTLWTKTYGCILGDNEGNDLEQTTDSGYIITGQTAGFRNANDVYLIKTNSIGDTLWTKIYGGADYNDVGKIVHQTSDGGYIICGSTGIFNFGGSDLLMIKTDSVGDTLWAKHYGTYTSGYGPNWERAYSMKQTSDGGYIVIGRLNNPYPLQIADGAYLVKTDSAGNVIWSKDYGTIIGSGGDEAQAIQQTADGGYIFVDFFSGTAIKLIKTDANGDTLWTKMYSPLGCFSSSIILTYDLGYLISGDAGLIKIDSMGDTLWTRNYYSFVGRSVQQTQDSGFILAGLWDNSGNFGLVKTDAHGNSTCSDNIPNIVIDHISYQYIDPQTYVALDTPDVIRPPTILGNVQATISSCFLLDAQYQQSTLEDFTAFINSSNNILLRFFSRSSEQVSMCVMDITGRVLLQQSLNAAEGLNRHETSAGFLAKGVYMVQLKSEDGVEVRKVEVE